ncbi:MAG: hypothetical protein QM757_36080, partial [Paludibaculum sp.]
MEDAVAFEHPPVVVEDAAGGVGYGVGAGFGDLAEVRLDVGRHAMDAGVGSAAAAVGGDDGLAGGGAGAGRLASVGAVGREALFRNCIHAHRAEP